MISLNQAQIEQALQCGSVMVFDELDSTNEYLLQHYANLASGTVCLAETQTAGRGRRGRQWYSPQGQNLYFSMLWKYPTASVADISSLSLVVAVVIAETFERLGVEDIQIKWPNDIYYQGKKAGGILIESKMDREQISLVIGIGLNVAMTAFDPRIVTQAWADFSRYHFDRNQLAATLAAGLQQMLLEFPQSGFEPYVARWQKFDLFYQQPVKLITANAEITGISQGINHKGELLLAQQSGIQAFAIGEISLRGS